MQQLKITHRIKGGCNNIFAKLEIFYLISAYIFIYGWRKKDKSVKKATAKNIIIVGGELLNKGSQAMVFQTIDELKTRFADKNIYLLSIFDYSRDEAKNLNYNFEIMHWNWKIKKGIFSKIIDRLTRRPEMRNTRKELEGIIKNTAFFVDISGYALSSQWSLMHSANYLLNIMIARKFSVPYYIFPQSIGPFNYRLRDKMFLSRFFLKSSLSYPEVIFVREESGLKELNRLGNKNAIKAYDIVLNRKEYNLSHIYRQKPNLKALKINPGSIGIIPNMKVIERTAHPDKIYSIYESLIKQLVNANKKVYILRHSYEDLNICQTIKNMFPQDESIELISDDLNTFELQNIIAQFDFIISSRYHSIIHAYNHNVPALVIGWAEKYFELLDTFGQLDYYFESRENIDLAKINSRLTELASTHRHKSEEIRDRLLSMGNRENIFNYLTG